MSACPSGFWDQEQSKEKLFTMVGMRLFAFGLFNMEMLVQMKGVVLQTERMSYFMLKSTSMDGFIYLYL